MPIRPTLPQHEGDREAREAALTRQQAAYNFDYKPQFLPQDDPSFDDVMFPVLASPMPKGEEFSHGYVLKRGLTTTRIFTSRFLMKTWRLFDPLDTLNDYNDNVFLRLPGGMRRPDIVDTFQEDYAFAAQRVSGANPLRLAAADASDSRLEILGRIQHADWKAKAADIVQHGRVFVADYTGDDPTYTGPSIVTQTSTAVIEEQERPKYLPKPLAIFYYDTESRQLMPLAIEVTRGGRVFTPKDAHRSGLRSLIFRNKDDWLFAKICVNVADGTHHELVWHLGRVHFAFEPVIVSTQRQLHESHPVNLLLRTHMRFHLANNKAAHDTLVAPYGSVDNLFATTRAEALKITLEAIRSYDINTMYFPEEIKSRGLGDQDALPDYPFRDDGMLVWDALEVHVRAYITHFYKSDEDLQADHEVQAWAKELATPTEQGGGQVGGFPEAITSIAQLVRLTTTIIFQCGPLHSAINFLQYEYEALCSNMPFACWADPEKLAQQQAISRRDLLSMLPPYGPAKEQLEIMFFLSAYRHDQLGEYEQSYKDLYNAGVAEVFSDHLEVVDIMQGFSKRLEEIEEIIDERNKSRKVKYDGFKPSLILNSTSI